MLGIYQFLKKKIKLSDKNNYWDTLIISWLLEPWKQTHALV